MCGISGFASADEVLANTAETFLKTSWDLMSHRGEDSGGWMSTTAEGFLDQDKLGGKPLTLLEKELLRKPTATKMLQAHNRYGTHGSASDNDNNHPVKFGAVQITHNGVLHNHTQIMNRVLSLKKYDNVNKKDLPDVDSVAIAMLVDAYLPDPTVLVEFPDAIAPFFDQCDDVSGSWAFAATWDKHPDYHMVARIDSSPVVFAANPELTRFVYASESGVLAQLCEDMDVDGSKLRTLDERTALLFKDGVLVQVFKYVGKPVVSYNGNSVMPDVWHRLRNNESFTSFNGKFDWVREDMPLRAIEFDTERFSGNMVQIDLDAVNSGQMFKQFADADVLYRYNHGMKSRWYAFYGDTEIVSQDGRLLDVYKDPMSSFDDLWGIVTTPKVEDVPASIKLKEFNDSGLFARLQSCSTVVSDFTLKKEQDDIRKRKIRQDAANNSLVQYYSGSAWDDEGELWWQQELAPRTNYIKSEKVPHVAFTENVKCKLHACYYVDHRRNSMANCPEAMMAYYAVLSAFEGDIVELADALDIGLIMKGGMTHQHAYITRLVASVEGETVTPIMEEYCGIGSCAYNAKLAENPLNALAELKGLMKNAVS